MYGKVPVGLDAAEASRLHEAADGCTLVRTMFDEKVGVDREVRFRPGANGFNRLEAARSGDERKARLVAERR